MDDNGYCQLKAPALRGEYVLMTYSVDLVKQGQFVPPVSASVVCECDQEYNKKVNVTADKQHLTARCPALVTGGVATCFDFISASQLLLLASHSLAMDSGVMQCQPRYMWLWQM